MRFTTLSSAALALSQMAMAAPEVHGSSNLGNTMGPVDFLWPESREWSADAQNTAPCGSNRGPGKRTNFPLKQGSVSLSIADDAYKVAFHIALDDDPEASAFRTQVVPAISEVESGHQCYGLNSVSGAKAGDNGTIQLQYWSTFDGDDNGKQQKFYACADIVFVELDAFDVKPPCFNVTSDEFNPASTGPSSTDSDKSTSGSSSSSGGGGLTTAAIAGIAVGTSLGSLAIVGLVAWFVLRKRKASRVDPDTEARRAYTKDVEEITH